MATSKELWQEYQDALRRGDKTAAAEAFRRYLAAKRAEGAGGSKPTLVNLSTKAKDYPNAIPLDQIPETIKTKPQFFELMKRIATREEK